MKSISLWTRTLSDLLYAYEFLCFPEVLNLTPSFLGIDIIVRRLGVAPMVAFVLLTKYTSVIDASHIAFLSHTVFTYLVTDFGDEIGILRLLWSTSVSLCPLHMFSSARRTLIWYIA